MEKRLRSPNYPAVSLREAVDKVRLLADTIGPRSADRESVAIAMGYKGLSGPSASAISALKKYGLLEGRGDSITVSDCAESILRPYSDDERAAALREAARRPALFNELFERFGDNVQNEGLLRNYLIRNKFAPNAADAAISAYKETVEFVGGFSSDYDSAPDSEMETDTMMGQHAAPDDAKRPTPSSASRPEEGEIVASYGNKDRGFVYIKATHGLSAKQAMAMAKRAIASFEDEEKEFQQQTAHEDEEPGLGDPSD